MYRDYVTIIQRTCARVAFVLVACGLQASCSSAREERAAADAPALPFEFRPQTCQASLFPPRDVASPIDFCRELVIIDPEIISKLPDFSFRTLTTRMFGADAPRVMKDWADSWKLIRGNDARRPRSDISDMVHKAWDEGRIKLIAVVNRLDLALDETRIPTGEGRLVYQLFDEGRAKDMTLIVEFDYPDIGSDREATISAWADAWHALSKVTSAGDYVEALGKLVARFAQPDAFRRIRTDEKLLRSETWAFREFAATVCTAQADASCTNALTWAELPHTPPDPYQIAPDALVLRDYLREPKVVTSLRAGEHEFGVRYGSQSFRALDWSAENQANSTWVVPSRTPNEALLLMAFNTCNGCHSDFRNSYGVLPHISIQGVGRQPELSLFLTSATNLNFPLAGCNRPPLHFGCIGDGSSPYAWNEQLHRVTYLLSRLRAERLIDFQIPATPLQYRYH